MTILTRLLPALALALLLAACSDSDSDRAAAPAASPSPRAAATASPGAQPAQPPVTSASRRGAQIFDPSAFTLALEPVLSGLRQPTYVASPPDGSGRLFVVERGGTIRVAENGRVLPQPFLDVTALITSQGQEQGLLGLAFHPRYAENGRFFVMYTARDGGANTVARYQVSADPNRADPAGATILLSIEDFASNHNGGMLAFGPDGYLYVGTGDGGQGGDPRRNGQNRGALLGKLLRLDVDAGEPYATPPDNPFAGQRDARPEVWAYGLRNPWRFAFDRATGDLWIADVGQGAWEEIDLQPAGSRGGENYGWNITEGTHCYSPRSGCDESGLIMPVAEYDHSDGRCSVTGGYVYRGAREPALAGAYLFGDWCTGEIWSLHRSPDGAWVQTALADTDLSLSSFGEDADGELYVTDLRGGRVYRLTATPR